MIPPCLRYDLVESVSFGRLLGIGIHDDDNVSRKL